MFDLVLPHLQKNQLPTPEEPLSIENLEFALLTLDAEAWTNVTNPSIIRRDDETYISGNSFFDELEDALANGEDINELLKQLTASTE